jgi:hypothetical protein
MHVEKLDLLFEQNTLLGSRDFAQSPQGLSQRDEVVAFLCDDKISPAPVSGTKNGKININFR